jgi:hypothetical protein
VRRAALAGILAAALLAAGGAGGGAGDGTTGGGTPAQRASGDRPPPDEQQLQEMLDRRARALLAGQADAYAATATGAQRGRDLREARVAQRLQLRDVNLQLRDATVEDGRATLDVVASWGIRGVRGVYVTERRMRAARRPGGWRITAVLDRRGRPPWELADYTQRDLHHFALLAPRDLAVADADLQLALEGGYEAIRSALAHVPLNRRYLVVVAPDAATARRMTVDIRGVEGLAAISDTAVHEDGPAKAVTKVVSQRLLVLWPAFAALGADERRRVIAHELTHAVLAVETSGRTPSWLVEGIALYTSGDHRSEQVRAALRGTAGEDGRLAAEEFSLRRLSAPDAIAGLTGARQSGAYAYASAAAFALADAHGSRAILRLYDAFNDEQLRGRPGPALVDRALRRTIGIGIDAFDAQVRASAG